jgi:hypothetical protein
MLIFSPVAAFAPGLGDSRTAVPPNVESTFTHLWSPLTHATFHPSPAVIDIYDLYSTIPVPTGLSDYGVLNSSGRFLPYEQAATEVTGNARINSIEAYNATPPPGSSPYGAGLQLNVMLRVDTTSGQYVYWLQNTLTIYTNNDTDYYVDNIWNASSPTAGLNPSDMSGTGSVYSNQFYASGTASFDYATPWTIKIPIAVSHSGDSVVVSFGYRQASNGNALPGKTTFYDRVVIKERHPVKYAAMVIDGYQMAPSGNYLDAELVFTGDTNGAETTFSKMNSTLSMSYALTDGLVRPPLSVFEFGSNTAEGAYNLQTDFVRGKFFVGIGTVNFNQSYSVKASPVIVTTLSRSAIYAGQSVYDSSTLEGSFRAGGTMTYEYFSGGSCSGAAVQVSLAKPVANGVVPNSASEAFSAVGTYSWNAVYSGDTHNNGATSPCERLTVLSAGTAPTHTTISCTKTTLAVGAKTTCTATVSGPYLSHTGTITWSKISGAGSVTFSSNACTLSSGKCSVTLTATTKGNFTIEATYSGDPHNPWSAGTKVLTITRART